jgi:DNA-binding transcriptional MerR regulator
VIEPDELMIGEFARRSRLPVSTLRYYDRIGLLVPAVVDPSNGYRRYTIDQLPAAVLISRLRSLGIAPDRIARVLAGGSGASTVLAGERRRIESEIELGRERLRGLDELITEGPPADYAVEVVGLAVREVAALPFLLPLAGLEAGVTRTIAALRSTLRRAGHERSGPWGATFPLDLSDEVSGFVFAPIADGPRDGLDTAWLPTGRAVATVHHGSTAALPLAYRAAFAVVDELGAVAAGPVIEEYVAIDDPCASSRSIHVHIPLSR